MASNTVGMNNMSSMLYRYINNVANIHVKKSAVVVLIKSSQETLPSEKQMYSDHVMNDNQVV